VLPSRGCSIPRPEFPPCSSLSSRLRLTTLRRLLLVAVAVSLYAAGCARKPPSKSELRAVTGEIVASAQNITAHKSEITIRPEIQSTQRSNGGAARQIILDSVYVTVADGNQTRSLEESVSNIARRHKLSVRQVASAGMVTMDLFSGDTRTHSIYIVTPVAGQPHAPSAGTVKGPRLAIILDDLGYDRAAADSLVALPFPLTVSVIPHLPLSSEVAEEAFRRGDEVLLHLPMESESPGAKREDVELRVGMNSQQVASELNGMLETVPHAVGVNNHQGSRATADRRLMGELMPELRKRGLFFIDSRTTTATVAYDVAEKSGVRAAARKVFLDDKPTTEAVRAQLELAAREAERDGFAIAIGHPHPATIRALTEMVPQLESRGIHFVFASAVVR
jgi:uncharacterized protein